MYLCLPTVPSAIRQYTIPQLELKKKSYALFRAFVANRRIKKRKLSYTGQRHLFKKNYNEQFDIIMTKTYNFKRKQKKYLFKITMFESVNLSIL